jgi:hypothetical protein
MDKSIKLIAEDVAAVLNDIIVKTRCFNGHVSGYNIVQKATEEEIMFFYTKICLRK